MSYQLSAVRYQRLKADGGLLLNDERMAMDNPIVNSLVLTVIGMAVVFVAMSLFYISMRLLTAVTQEKQPLPDTQPDLSTSPVQPQQQDRSIELRAAAIAVALARAEAAESAPAGLYAGDHPSTLWGAYYRQRQLRPGGRGRLG